MSDTGSMLSQFAVQAGEAAAVMKSLSNEARLLVLCHLSEASELSAGELTRRIGLSQSALSQHLARLRLGNHAEGGADGLLPRRRSEDSSRPRGAS